jgi:hypothetical protein
MTERNSKAGNILKRGSVSLFEMLAAGIATDLESVRVRP